MAAVIIIVILGGIVLLGGGHTLEGFGNDLKQGGERLHRINAHEPAPEGGE
ncbi:MAG: entericidin [Proteobacteria bacterium]|nr:entericidin [Pseudomonadota bacterium]